MGSGSYKLTFPLCTKCVEEESGKPLLEKSYECAHTDAERTLRGTWCSSELEKAVSLGYRVLRIHEVWHFEESQEGLFAPYVDTWLKIKQESAGYPPWCRKETDRMRYVSECERKEGIRLDAAKITRNPGSKAVAKLMLNSFW